MIYLYVLVTEARRRDIGTLEDTARWRNLSTSRIVHSGLNPLQGVMFSKVQSVFARNKVYVCR